MPCTTTVVENMVLGMTLNWLHRVIYLPHPGANDLSCWIAVKQQQLLFVENSIFSVIGAWKWPVGNVISNKMGIFYITADKRCYRCEYPYHAIQRPSEGQRSIASLKILCSKLIHTLIECHCTIQTRLSHKLCELSGGDTDREQWK